MDSPQIGDFVTIPWNAGRIEGKVVFVDQRQRICKVRVLRYRMKAPHTGTPRDDGPTHTMTHAFDAVWPYAVPRLAKGDRVSALWGGIPISGAVDSIDCELRMAAVTFRWGAGLLTKSFGWHLLKRA